MGLEYFSAKARFESAAKRDDQRLANIATGLMDRREIIRTLHTAEYLTGKAFRM